MTVLPDILLPGAGLAAGRTPSASPAETSRTAPREPAPAFAEVYAKERQARPAERSSAPDRRDAPADGQARAAERGKAPAHARRDERVGEPQETDAAPVEDTEQPAEAVAGKDGKELPPEQGEGELDAEGQEDSLALLGLSLGQAVTAPTAAADEAPAPGGEEDPAAVTEDPLTAAQTLAGLGVAPATETPAAAQDAPAEGEGAGDELALVATGDKGEKKAAGAASGGMPALAMTTPDGAGEAAAGSPAEPVLAALAEGTTPGQSSRESSGREAFSARLNGLAQALGQQPGVASRPAAVVPGQPVAVHQPGMSEAVVDRVMWMSSQNLKSAEIQLDPAELGRMEVRIELVKDQAQVTFLSPHAGVRDALEGQMQRLREMFTQQGLNLADVNVADQQARGGWQGQGGDQPGRGAGRAGGRTADDEVAVGGVVDIAANRQGGQRGLVDYYA